jgi:uncharacterized membrane protein HdeD (DUF308 family)
MFLASNWWTLTIRGIVAILFGIFTFFRPGTTLTALALVFGAYALVDGIFSIVAAIRGRRHGERRWVLAAGGVAGVAAAAVTFLWPGITVLAMVLVVAFWALVTGIVELAAAIRLRKFIEGEWLLALAGIASIVFGALLIVWPLTGAIVVAWWIGAYAAALGAILLALSFRLRWWTRQIQPGAAL